MPSDDPLSAQTAEKAAPHHMAADSSTLIGNGSSDVGCEHDALAAQPQRPSQDPGGPMQRSAAASTSSRREGLSAPDVGSLGDGAAGSAGGTEARSSGGEGTKQARTPLHECLIEIVQKPRICHHLPSYERESWKCQFMQKMTT